MDDALFLALLLAAVGSGLVGGIFFAFSAFIMEALDRLPPAQAVSAMRSINVAVLNPAFFAVFFGTGAIAFGLGVAALWHWRGEVAILMLFGGLAYLAGCIFVTMRFNVPLNHRLAAAEVAGPGAEAAWSGYRRSWTAWNTFRTVASLAASAAFILALRP